MPTKIEWTQETWNPVTGCTKVSEGCRNCYAERMARRLAGRYGYPEAPHHFDVTLHPDKLEQPLRWKKPRTVFVCSMSDFFHESVSDEFIYRVFRIMEQCPQHTFQILTKRPLRMMIYLEYYQNRLCPESFPDVFPNVWLGVSVENQKTADERIPLLLQTPAAVRFVSYEPALAAVKLFGFGSPLWGKLPPAQFLHWVICGGESGAGARPMHPDWARSVRDRCQAVEVAFFFKQWGAWLPELDSHGLWPEKPSGDLIPNARQIYVWPDGSSSIRHGKKAAGRLLDGREWNEMPETGRP